MIWNVELQNEYNNLYILLREYIWDFNIVCKIADLEISCYQTCPDIPIIKEQLSKLKYAISNTVRDNEDLQEEFDIFEDLLDKSNDTYYADIPIVQATVQKSESELDDIEDPEIDNLDNIEDDYDFDDMVKDESENEESEELEDENFEENNQ